MVAEVDNTKISVMIHELYESVGIRAPAEHGPLIDILVNQENPQKVCEMVAAQMKLPVRINLVFLDNFLPNPLSSIGAAAAVDIPDDLPLFGSDELRDFPITIRIVRKFLDYPDVFISFIAHELSHILLSSQQNKNRESEIHTDICAMLMGFSVCMHYARITVRNTANLQPIRRPMVIYSYLYDNDFAFAYQEINELWLECADAANRLSYEVVKLKKSSKQLLNLLWQMDCLLDMTRIKPRRDITPEDRGGIDILLFGDDIMGCFYDLWEKALHQIEHYGDLLQERKHYNSAGHKSMKTAGERCAQLDCEINQTVKKLRNSRRILFRNITPSAKYRIMRRFFSSRKHKAASKNRFFRF